MTLKLNYLLVCLALTLSFPLTARTYTYDDGLSHTENFLFNEDASRYNDIEVTNDSQLNSRITLEGDSGLNTEINIRDGGVINADIIDNKTNGGSHLAITDSKQPNQFTVHNNTPINPSDPKSSNTFGVSIQSSDADYQIFNNGKYGEILAGGANTPSYSNPNIINLKHHFYGDSQANVRWLDSEITGDIVLSDNAYAYYDAYLRTRFTGTITLHDTSTFDFAFFAANNGGSSASIVNADIVVKGSATANFMFGDYHFGYMTSQAVLNGDMVVSDNAKGNVLTKSWGGVWNGNLMTKDNAQGQYRIEREDNPRANWDRWIGEAIARDNSTIQIALEQGSMWTGRANEYDNASIDVSLNDASSGRVRSQWLMTGNSTISSLTSHDGEVYLSLPTTDFSQFNTLTTERLSGNGTFIFNTNIARNQGDVLIANTVDTGSQFLLGVNNQAGVYTKAYQDLLLVKTQQGDSDAFTLVHNVEVGGYEYTLVQKGSDWYLTSPDYKPTTTLKTAVGSAYTTYLLDVVTNDVLVQRQGELRTAAHANGEVWVKQTGGRIRHVNQNIGLLDNVQMSYYGLQMGADKQLEDSDSFIGLTTGYIAASQHYGAENKGAGSTDGFNIGAYFTALYENSIYLNVFAKYSDYNNDFTAIDTAGDSIHGDSATQTLSASLEVGYQHEFENVYLAPFAQLTLTRFSSYSLTASNDLTVNIGRYHSLLSKIGLNIGVTHFDTKNTQLYVNTELTKEFLANVNVMANDVHDKSGFKNHWFSSSLGITSEFLPHHNVYSDIEFTYGGKFKNTRINMGYQYRF